MKPASYQFSSPRFRQLGYLCWLVMLIMAIVFYKERSIFLDAAFQLEELINKKAFTIYYYRLVNPFTQILALIAIYLELPLKAVMVAYSVNFILFFGGIYYAIVHWCRNDYLGWVQLFFFTLMVLDCFYYLPPDLYQGTSLFLLWWAILLKYPQLDNKWILIGLILFMIPILSTSRLVSTYFFFCFAFFWFSNKELRHWRYFLLVGFLILFMQIHNTYFVSAYDAGKMAAFHENIDKFYPNYHEIPSHFKFLKKLKPYYYFYVIFLLIVIFGYLVALFKRIEKVKFPLLKIGMVVGANLFYLLLIHLSSPTTGYRFYAELYYLPLSVFTCIPLVFDIAPMVKNEKWVLYAFFITVAIRINVIINNHKTFENRLDWYSLKMEEAKQKGSNKSIIDWWKAPRKLMLQPWASPQETLLLSSLRGPANSATIYLAKNNKDHTRVLKEGHFFLANYNFYTKEVKDHFNKRYFEIGREEQYIKLELKK